MRALHAGLALGLLLWSGGALAQSSGADAAMAALGERYAEAVARADPVAATARGDHRYDDLLPDLSPAAQDAQGAGWRAMLADLTAIDRSALSRDNAVDAAMLEQDLRARLWRMDVLQPRAWMPQAATTDAIEALASLAEEDDDGDSPVPWPQRLLDAAARMEAMPAFLAAARAATVPARVPRLHAEVAAQQVAALPALADGLLAAHVSALAPAERARLASAAEVLHRAAAEHGRWIETVLLPATQGNVRLGPALYDAKLAVELPGAGDRAALKSRALAALTHVRQDMYGIARGLVPDAPAAPSPEEEQRVIAAALAKAAQAHPPRDGVGEVAQAALDDAARFVASRGLLSVPDLGPIRVVPMPWYRRGLLTAYARPPGAPGRAGGRSIALASVPPEWDEAQAGAFLAEYNRYALADLAVHEGVPGHLLQAALAGRQASPVRRLAGSAAFAEGWAVYAEGMMADAGFGGNDPLYRLVVLRMRLRSIANALLDIGIHAEGMDHDAAMRLLVHDAFQQPAEAEAKWRRACLGSVQLASYFAGYDSIEALRTEAEMREGETFDLARFHDALLSHGEPPLTLLRALVLGLPIDAGVPKPPLRDR